jgi:hypothetical protein
VLNVLFVVAVIGLLLWAKRFGSSAPDSHHHEHHSA